MLAVVSGVSYFITIDEQLQQTEADIFSMQVKAPEDPPFFSD